MEGHFVRVGEQQHHQQRSGAPPPTIYPTMLSIAPPIAPTAYRTGATPSKSGAWFIILIAIFVGGVAFACLSYVAPKFEVHASSAAPQPTITAEPPPIATVEAAPTTTASAATSPSTSSSAVSGVKPPHPRPKKSAATPAPSTSASATADENALPSDRLPTAGAATKPTDRN